MTNLPPSTHSTTIKEDGPSPDQFDALIELYSQGELQSLIGRATVLLDQFPHSVDLYNIIGASFSGMGLNDQAIGHFRKALQISPSHDQTHNNLGAALKGLGQLEAAIASYAKAIELKPDFVEAHNNIGIAFYELGRLDDAIASSMKALQIKPDLAEANNNVGNVYYAQGRPHNAIAAYTKALRHNPSYAEAHHNIGTAFKSVGRSDEAISSYVQALQINPNFAEAHGNLGHVLRENARSAEAIASYTKAIELKSDKLEYWQGMTLALCAMPFDSYDPHIANVCIAIIEKQTLVHPSVILDPILRLLEHHQIIRDDLLPEVLDSDLEKAVCELSNIPLLLHIMETCPIPNLAIERLLKTVRRALLVGLENISDNQNVVRFQMSLASQCWINEFVYGETEEESLALDKLEASIAANFRCHEHTNDRAIACLASYRPLHQFDWSKTLGDRSALTQVFQMQVREVEEEIALRDKIPSLKNIQNPTSVSVREQYEQSPYPRWVYTNIQAPTERVSSAASVAKRIGLDIAETDTLLSVTPDILIAGCGTGQQSLISASRFSNSRILAVDLSLSSLSYAERKTKELGVANIEYMQADILDLDALGRQFDVIESTGVLHHMDDPMAGWDVLNKCLKPGGLMKISLYSAMARQPVRAARDKISVSGLSNSIDDILKFRADILETVDTDLAALRSWADFYSTSEFRDLVFHIVEHQFTLPQIRACLTRLELNFVGFEFGGGRQKSQFKKSYSDSNALYDLNKWHEFEVSHPDCFAGMYQLWAQKPLYQNTE